MLGESVARYLAAEGHGTFGTDITLGYQPDDASSPGAKLITISEESAGVLPESQGYSVDQCGIQVTVRSADYAEARDVCIAVHKQLVGFGGQLVAGGSVVTSIMISQYPASIGVDEHLRAEWTCHYTLRFETTGEVHRVTS